MNKIYVIIISSLNLFVYLFHMDFFGFFFWALSFQVAENFSFSVFCCNHSRVDVYSILIHSLLIEEGMLENINYQFHLFFTHIIYNFMKLNYPHQTLLEQFLPHKNYFLSFQCQSQIPQLNPLALYESPLTTNFLPIRYYVIQSGEDHVLLYIFSSSVINLTSVYFFFLSVAWGSLDCRECPIYLCINLLNFPYMP